MVETNINAYKAELEEATVALAKAQTRVDELTSYIAEHDEVVEEVTVVEVKKGKK